MLNIMGAMGAQRLEVLSVDRLHLEIEAARLAYRERNAYIADPTMVDVPVERLLSHSHTANLCTAIDMRRAMDAPQAIALPERGDTVYLCVVDEERNAVSLINSIFSPFGSGLTGPKSGVLLQNRGMAFSLAPGHPNCISPGKRPLHTIIPGMLVKDGRAVMPFGVMGGQYQAAGHVHFLNNLLDFGLDVQEALDLPRVFPLQDGSVEAETGIPPEAAAGLRRRGHRLRPSDGPIGGGQAIWIDWEQGVLTGGSDPRKDGCALGY